MRDRHATPTETAVPDRAEPLRVAGLRVVAVLLAVLGFFPLANYLDVGQGFRGWSGAVRQWLVASAVILSAAILLGGRLALRIDRLAARADGWLLAPSQFAFGVGVATLTFALAAGIAWFCFGR